MSPETADHCCFSGLGGSLIQPGRKWGTLLPYRFFNDSLKNVHISVHLILFAARVSEEGKRTISQELGIWQASFWGQAIFGETLFEIDLAAASYNDAKPLLLAFNGDAVAAPAIFQSFGACVNVQTVPSMGEV